VKKLLNIGLVRKQPCIINLRKRGLVLWAGGKRKRNYTLGKKNWRREEKKNSRTKI